MGLDIGDIEILKFQSLMLINQHLYFVLSINVNTKSNMIKQFV